MPSSEMLRLVALERIHRNFIQLLVTAVILVTLIMAAIRLSETSALIKVTPCNIPENHILLGDTLFLRVFSLMRKIHTSFRSLHLILLLFFIHSFIYLHLLSSSILLPAFHQIVLPI
jgi:hypothetical protein